AGKPPAFPRRSLPALPPAGPAAPLAPLAPPAPPARRPAAPPAPPPGTDRRSFSALGRETNAGLPGWSGVAVLAFLFGSGAGNERRLAPAARGGSAAVLGQRHVLLQVRLAVGIREHVPEPAR